MWIAPGARRGADRLPDPQDNNVNKPPAPAHTLACFEIRQDDAGDAHKLWRRERTFLDAADTTTHPLNQMDGRSLLHEIPLPFPPPPEPPPTPPPPFSPNEVPADKYNTAIAIITIAHAAILLIYVIFCLSVPARRDTRYRDRLHAWLAVSWSGTSLTSLHALSSLASCILLICEGYLLPNGPVMSGSDDGIAGYRGGLPFGFLLAEQIFQPIFVCHYFLLFYVAGRQWLMYIFSLMSIIDIVTVIPVYIELMSLLRYYYAAMNNEPMEGTGNSTALSIFRMIRAVKVVRILRISQIWGAFLRFTSNQQKRVTQQSARGSNVGAGQTREANHQQFKLLSSILLMLIVTTGFVQWVSTEYGFRTNDGTRALFFHEALYFTVVTLSTVGYGDMVPEEALGRVIMIILVVAFMFFVPYQSARFFELRRLVSAYRGSYNSPSEHIVICCDPNCTTVRNFLLEFFHPDHGVVSHVHVVLLVHSEPTPVMREVLLDFADVTYLNGDVLNSHDMARARLDTATGCFVLADTSASNTQAADALTLMRAIAIHNYRPHLRKVVQLLNPKLKVHLMNVGLCEHHIVCVEELQLTLAAQGALRPGLTALVGNLCTSISVQASAAPQHGAWFSEYLHGLDQEIYTEALPAYFANRSFSLAASLVYQEYGVLLIGVIAETTNDLLLAPGHTYQIKDGDTGIFVAPSAAIIDTLLTAEMTSEEWLSHDPQLAQAIRKAESTEVALTAAEASAPSPSAGSSSSSSTAPAKERPKVVRLSPEAIDVTSSPQQLNVETELAEVVVSGIQRAKSSPGRRANAVKCASPAMASPPKRFAEGSPAPANMFKRTVSAAALVREASASSAGSDKSGGSKGSKRSMSTSPGLAVAMERQAGFMDRRMPTESEEANLQYTFKRSRTRNLDKALRTQQQLPLQTDADRVAARHSRTSITGSPLPPADPVRRFIPEGAPRASVIASTSINNFESLVARTVPARPFETACLGDANEANLRGHVVLLSDSLRSLRHFILPLRQPSQPCIPILIVTSLKVDDARTHWLDLATFPQVYLLHSVGDLELDAPRAALPKASSIVVRSAQVGGMGGHYGDGGEHDPLVQAAQRDAVTILTTLQAERVCGPDTHIVSEILQGDTLAQLSAKLAVTGSTPSAGGINLPGLNPEVLITGGRARSFLENANDLPAEGTRRALGEARRVSFDDVTSPGLTGDQPLRTEQLRPKTAKAALPSKLTSWMHTTTKGRASPTAMLDSISSTADADDGYYDEHQHRVQQIHRVHQEHTFDDAFDSWAGIGEGEDTGFMHHHTSEYGSFRGSGHRMPQMAACFAAGKVVLADIADKLSSQAFFNPYIMSLVNAMINPSDHNAKAQIAAAAEASQAAATGRADPAPYVPSAHLCLIAIPRGFRKVAASVARRSSAKNVTAASASSDPPPFVTWGYLWDWMLRELGIVCIATYAHVTASGAAAASYEVSRATSRNTEVEGGGGAGGVPGGSPAAAFQKALRRASAAPTPEKEGAAGGGTPAPDPDKSGGATPWRNMRKAALSLVSRATSSDDTASSSQFETPVDPSAILSQAFVVTNPPRKQPLRESDLLFAFVPPAMLDDPRIVRVYCTTLPPTKAPAATSGGLASVAAAARKAAAAAAPAVPPPSYQEKRPAEVGVAASPTSPPTVEALQKEVARLTAALAMRGE